MLSKHIMALGGFSGSTLPQTAIRKHAIEGEKSMSLSQHFKNHRGIDD